MIGRATIYRWLNRQNLEQTKVKRRQRKLDWKALEKDVQENPDAKLIERAKKNGVHPTAIWYALNKMKITKKRTPVSIKKQRRKNKGLFGTWVAKLLLILKS